MSSILADHWPLAPKCKGERGWGVSGSANEYSCAHEAQINFGDLTPYLTYANRARSCISISFFSFFFLVKNDIIVIKIADFIGKPECFKGYTILKS
jgi:hypothetical protein